MREKRVRGAAGPGYGGDRSMKKRFVSFVLVAALLLVGALLFERRGAGGPSNSQSLDIWGAGSSESESTPLPPEATVTPVNELYSAMWLSYLEWESMDFSSEAAFTASVSTVMANCANLGLDTVLVQVRPFGDALYASEIFPASHLMTGAQGQSPGFDPLAILINGARAAGLRIEAWINPYRVQLNAEKPAALSENNPAVRWMADESTADYVIAANGGLYYNPGEPAVRQLIKDGVQELMDSYELDGILFDDYFYPTTDASFDADTYAKYGGGMSLEAWRRQNVNTLVREVYALIKAADPACTFGISPSGNIKNNLTEQYSEVSLWLAEPGYVDYLMPQLYWGFDYVTSTGNGAFAFERCLASWATLQRSPSVQLYVALGAYRIGDGDGGSEPSDEWQNGQNLARQVEALRTKASGFSLYRYDFLYKNTAWADLAASELNALQALLMQ